MSRRFKAPHSRSSGQQANSWRSLRSKRIRYAILLALNGLIIALALSVLKPDSRHSAPTRIIAAPALVATPPPSAPTALKQTIQTTAVVPSATPAIVPSQTPSLMAVASATLTPAPTSSPTAPSTATPANTATPQATATLLPTASPNPTEAALDAVALPAMPTFSLARAALAAQHSRYQVGAYYFSGWSHGQNDNINPMLTSRFHTSEPLIGWYDDTQASVDRSIDQAADAGITFFAFDWYDIARSPYPTDQTLNEGLTYYLSSTQRYRLKFCVMFADHAPFIPQASEWPGLIDNWITLFKQPDYVHVNGKPLFVVFSPDYMRQIFGSSAGVHAALDELRSRAIAAGLPGVTVAGAMTVSTTANPAHLQQLNADGYDVSTGYSYHGMGGEQYNVPAPYHSLVQENVDMWSRVAERVHLPYIPVITSGFDLRHSIREQRTAIIYDGRTPRQFACYAVMARHWVDTHPGQTAPERVVLVYAWTEMGEGGAIIPSVAGGYGYANAIGTVFGTADAPPSTPAYCH